MNCPARLLNKKLVDGACYYCYDIQARVCGTPRR